MTASSGPSRPHFASTSLYVGDLGHDVNETNLYEFFNTIGPVASIRVCRDSGSRRSLGYAYVNYHSIVDAERALDALNYTPIKGQTCRIMWSQRDPTVRKTSSGNLFVKNLDRGVDNRALHDTFSLFGNILSCKVVQDEAGKSKGYGFVHFESDDAAAAAVERVNGMKIGSKEVFVGQFHKRHDRPSGKSEYFTNLYMRNFPKSWTEETINKLYEPFGTITSVFVSADKHQRPYACVNLADPADAKRALETLNGKKVDASGVLANQNDDDVPATEDTKATSDAPAKSDADKTEAEGKENADSSRTATAETDAQAEGDKAKAKAKTETDIKAEEGKAEKKQAAKDNVEGEDGEGAAAVSNKAVDEDEVAAKKDESKEGKKGKDGEDEKEKGKGEGKEAALAAESKEVYVLYVDRAQDKTERMSTLKNRYENRASNYRSNFEGINLYIKNLSDNVDDEALLRMFQPFGTITSAKVMKDESGRSKGFGFVSLASAEEAAKAIADMHLKLHDGKPLYVGLAESKERRHMRLTSHFKDSRSRGMNGTAHHAMGLNGAPMMNASQAHVAHPHGPQAGQLGGPGPMHMAGPQSGAHLAGGPQIQMAGGQQMAGTHMHGPHAHGPGAPHQMQTPYYMAGQPQSGASQPPHPMVWQAAAGYSQQGLPQQGLPQQAMPQQGMPQQGMMWKAPYVPTMAPQMFPQHGGYRAAAAAQPHAAQAAQVQQAQAQAQAQPQSQAGGQAQVSQAQAGGQAVSKQSLGEQLYPLVYMTEPRLAGKITGMMLDMDNSELERLIHSKEDLQAKIGEALIVLEEAAKN